MRKRLDRRLEHLKRVEAEGGDYDEPGVEYVSQGHVWANMQVESGRESVRADRVGASAGVILTVRYHVGEVVSARDRFKDESGRVLHVTGPPREMGRREGFEIVCTRRD